MHALFVYQRDTYYHKRSNVETAFLLIKRKFGDSLRSKSDTGQTNEVLCKVITPQPVLLGRGDSRTGASTSRPLPPRPR